MKVQLRRILMRLKGFNLSQEIRIYEADKTSKNYRVYSEDSNNRLIPHESLMKPIYHFDGNDLLLNIWCFNEQINEASEILIAYGIKRTEEARKLRIREIQTLELFNNTLTETLTKP